MAERIERHDALNVPICPHSGNRPRVVVSDGAHGPLYRIECPSRYCSLHTDQHKTLDAAKADWVDLCLTYPN